MQWWEAALIALISTSVGALAAAYGSIVVNNRQARRRSRAQLLSEVIPAALHASEVDHDVVAFVRHAGDVERIALVAGDADQVDGLDNLIVRADQKSKHVAGAKTRASLDASAQEEMIQALREFDDLLDEIYRKLDRYQYWLRGQFSR